MPVRIVSDIDQPSTGASLLGFLGPAVATLGAMAGDAVAAHKAKAAMANPLADMLSNRFQTPQVNTQLQPMAGGAFSGLQLPATDAGQFSMPAINPTLPPMIQQSLGGIKLPKLY